MDNACKLLGLDDGVSNPTEGLALRQGLNNAIDLQMAVGYFTLGGICERHPDLSVAFLEGTGGWMVPMLERFDHQIQIFGSRDQRTLPSELFARQCMVSFDPDEVALAFTARGARCRQAPLGVRLPASRRQDPRRREGARGSGQRRCPKRHSG